MGKAVRLVIPDFCEDEHRLYHVVGRACAICVPDPYARYCLWNEDHKCWWPLAWVEEGYWDEEHQCVINGEGERVSIPAISSGSKPFQGWGPGVQIEVEDIPSDVYERLMEAQKVGNAPGSFDEVWFEYEDKKKHVDS